MWRLPGQRHQSRLGRELFRASSPAAPSLRRKCPVSATSSPRALFSVFALLHLTHPLPPALVPRAARRYRARLHSVSLHSNTGTNIYYSFERGLTHFLVFSAEAYLYARNAAFLANQLAFMKADLSGVDRTRTPWVVALVHKDYSMEGEAFAAFAPLLNAGGVDVLFCGHVHYYMRNAPFDSVAGKADSGSVSADTHTYTEPKFMVSIVSGSSGDHEDDHKCPTTLASPQLTCSQNYGYGFFEAVNATTATWFYKTVRADGPGPQTFNDTLTIVQHNHRLSTL
jgi:hypothetical protein